MPRPSAAERTHRHGLSTAETKMKPIVIALALMVLPLPAAGRHAVNDVQYLLNREHGRGT
jgi:hypothetical protein